MSETIMAQARKYHHLISEMNAVYHDAALKLGLSDSTLMILYTLAHNDGVCLISTVVRQSGISKQTVHSALRKLEAEGMVLLEAAGKKSKRIRLTEQGQALVHRTAAQIIAIENKIYSSWKPEEWALYLELTSRFLNQCKEEFKNI